MVHKLLMLGQLGNHGYKIPNRGVYLPRQRNPTQWPSAMRPENDEHAKVIVRIWTLAGGHDNKLLREIRQLFSRTLFDPILKAVFRILEGVDFGPICLTFWVVQKRYIKVRENVSAKEFHAHSNLAKVFHNRTTNTLVWPPIQTLESLSLVQRVHWKREYFEKRGTLAAQLAAKGLLLSGSTPSTRGSMLALGGQFEVADPRDKKQAQVVFDLARVFAKVLLALGGRRTHHQNCTSELHRNCMDDDPVEPTWHGELHRNLTRVLNFMRADTTLPGAKTGGGNKLLDLTMFLRSFVHVLSRSVGIQSRPPLLDLPIDPLQIWTNREITHWLGHLDVPGDSDRLPAFPAFPGEGKHPPRSKRKPTVSSPPALKPLRTQTAFDFNHALLDLTRAFRLENHPTTGASRAIHFIDLGFADVNHKAPVNERWHWRFLHETGILQGRDAIRAGGNELFLRGEKVVSGGDSREGRQVSTTVPEKQDVLRLRETGRSESPISAEEEGPFGDSGFSLARLAAKGGDLSGKLREMEIGFWPTAWRECLLGDKDAVKTVKSAGNGGGKLPLDETLCSTVMAMRPHVVMFPDVPAYPYVLHTPGTFKDHKILAFLAHVSRWEDDWQFHRDHANRSHSHRELAETKSTSSPSLATSSPGSLNKRGGTQYLYDPEGNFLHPLLQADKNTTTKQEGVRALLAHLTKDGAAVRDGHIRWSARAHWPMYRERSGQNDDAEEVVRRGRGTSEGEEEGKKRGTAGTEGPLSDPPFSFVRHFLSLEYEERDVCEWMKRMADTIRCQPSTKEMNYCGGGDEVLICG